MTIINFEDLEIWKEARELCKKVKEITQKQDFSKDFKFRDQLRASSGSVMDNIAEGFGRGGNKEFSQFLSIAKGSNAEVRSQILRALDYEYIDNKTCDELLQMTSSVSNKINKLMIYLKNSTFKGKKYK
jgi:four helix bundle protein